VYALKKWGSAISNTKDKYTTTNITCPALSWYLLLLIIAMRINHSPKFAITGTANKSVR
jgi:hypothetical protein